MTIRQAFSNLESRPVLVFFSASENGMELVLNNVLLGSGIPLVGFLARRETLWGVVVCAATTGHLVGVVQFPM